jgi:hypothetical protein
MYQGPSWDKGMLARQVRVTEEARKRGYPIYVTWRQQPKEVAWTTLPGDLQRAVERHDKLYYYNGLLGNALQGNALEGGELQKNVVLEKTLEKSRARVAIVFGQEYGQCVDSTILGLCYTPLMPKGAPQVYTAGLLNVGIDVVTARDVLAPPQPQNTNSDSRYFYFDMEDAIDIESYGPSYEPPPPAAAPSALDAPLRFHKDAATKAAIDSSTTATTQA